MCQTLLCTLLPLANGLQAKIDETIKDNLKQLKANALAAQLVNVQVPDTWSEATSQKQRAQQEIDFALNEREQSVAAAANMIVLAKQDALMANQTAMANVNVILATALQDAAAITAEYEAFGTVLYDMMKDYKLDFAGLMKFLENQLVANSQSVDLVLPGGALGA